MRSLLFTLAFGLVSVIQPAMAKQAFNSETVITKIRHIEQQLSAKVGVALLTKQGDILLQYQGDKSFPLNSTHKAFSCGMLLDLVEQGKISLAQQIQIRPQDIVPYSPILAQKTTLNVMEMCEASVSYSDNTAANLVMLMVGGVQKFNDYVIKFGLTQTHLDRFEPELNYDNLEKGLDLTTPLEAGLLMKEFAFGESLSAKGQKQWLQWLKDNKVADALLRNTLPKGWGIADKSGAGGQGSRSIVSVFWLPNGTPYILTIYLTDTKATMSSRNQAIADIGLAVFQALK